ncbi:MAG: Bax inhibitor-1/YccA family protein [Sphingomonadales bacterium]|nr:Bax inhibitor-1/YccA family protein [Sphingomonadales bacterium]NCQ21569.1 Bax inhibitor-1/YccA family protein [Sphingomonadales bacterium]NCT04355.1 Bax inhibitor-1/YccA family protein [Sphingomonadales bacterium]
MADWNDTSRNAQRLGSVPRAGGDVAGRAGYDEGLRKHMLSIYNYMGSAVLLTGIVALLFVNSPLFAMAFNAVATPAGTVVQPTGLGWLITLSPLAVMLFWWFGAQRASTGALQVAFWAFATLFGLSLSTIFVTYTGESVASAFFSTAAAFAGLSLWGYTTKRDISGWGSFLVMGVIGLLVAMLLNAFVFQSGAMGLVISVLGVLIFAGLTAYDTQRLKNEYSVVRGTEMAGRAVIFGALSLYLDFINMFLFILRMFGSRE